MTDSRGIVKRRVGAAGVHVALLRGINLGGKNKLPMKELCAMFEKAGCSDVRHYIQSGNVVFKATEKVVKALSRTIPEAISSRFEYDVPVVVFSSAELAEVASENPFVRARADSKTLHVAFLAHAPAIGAIASLDPKRSPGDEFEVVGRRIYLRLPNGVARSRLTNAYFDAKLGTTSTLRNWATVETLLAMTEE